MNQEFKVNKRLTLKLEEGKTNIYVNDKLFNQCKFLLLEIPVKEMTSLDEIESIDEVADRLDNSLELQNIEIPPEVEFWGHCSNLQVWYEHEYDTRLLKNNLAFPLLKKLTEAGDLIAKKVFKEEIAKRLSSGEQNTFDFLIQEGYSDYLNREEFLASILNHKESEAIKEIEHKLRLSINFIYEKENENQCGLMVQDKHIIYLSLFDRNIKEIPVELGDFRYLEHLNLSYNEIETIPISIINLKMLKNLILDVNIIQGLPESLGELESLEILSLVDNQIKNLPESIGELTNLKRLNLAINDISSLPDSLGNLKSLEYLQLSSNKIVKLTDSIGKLKALKELYVEYNKLESLTTSIGKLTNLKSLYLEHNNISIIPESIGELKLLKFLNVKNNKIKKKEDLPQGLLRNGLTIYV